jgi:hypothetical protein
MTSAASMLRLAVMNSYPRPCLPPATSSPTMDPIRLNVLVMRSEEKSAGIDAGQRSVR